MSETTAISWTDATWSPWWGCTPVSEACRNCYARTLAKRYGHDAWGVDKPRRFLSEAHWKLPERWNRKAEREGRRIRVFPSMCDPFESANGYIALGAERRRFWCLIERTPWLAWLILTKRPENAADFSPAQGWPSNVWLGVTVEDQATADERIPWLLEIPAAVRFVSYEPALGPVDFTNISIHEPETELDPRISLNALTGLVAGPDEFLPNKVDWLIAGGETGPKARPAHPDWVRAARDACVAAGVPFHFKTWGSRALGADGLVMSVQGRQLDGRVWDQVPEVQEAPCT